MNLPATHEGVTMTDDMTDADAIRKLTIAARRTDPLFSSNPERSFEPTIEDVIEYIDIQGQTYNFPRSARDRMTLSFDPDRLAAVSDIAIKHDMTVSATIDLLLRVALGDYEEWWSHNSGHFPAADEADQEDK